jgi:hypothetical protein
MKRMMRTTLLLLILLSVGASTLGADELHWSFRKPVRPPVPKVSNTAWVRNPIDAFILRSLQSKGLSPSPPADRRTLIRRVTIDLIGLPPTPEEVRAFLADKSPNAYEKVVARLLASPRYGERWGQHWLDVVRFAETNGYELDAERPQAWRYRDYVIQALNQDKPYDRFLSEQIAGDEIAPDDFDLRVATGFLRAGPQHVVGGNQDEAVNRQEWLSEATIGIGNGVLGLTINCARCHDHKYDPISQADYYRLQAFFAASDNQEYKKVTKEQQEAYDAAVKAHAAKLKPINEQIAVIEKPYRERLRQEKIARLESHYANALKVPADKRTPDEKKLAGEAGVLINVSWDEVLAVLTPADREKRTALRRKLHALEYEAPEPLPAAQCVSDTLSPVPAVHVLLRGDPHRLGTDVQPGFPGVLAPQTAQGAQAVSYAPAPDKKAKSTGRRMALAQWLTRPDHPLTARVMVNRLWHYHFGKGIVATPNDFGRNGKRPTHPELLDWLATEFVRRGWSLKQMHALMACSNTYRQSSAYDAKKASVDLENHLLWRMNRQRLDAETLRDSILQTAGTLNLETGGPSIRVPLEPEVYDTIFTEGEPDNLWPIARDPRQHGRRSVYLLRKRNVRLPMLAVFDQPDMMSSCGARGQSVHALQALTLINSDFMLQQSRALARRLFAEAPTDEKRRIARLYELAYSRLPSTTETASTQRFLTEQKAILRERLAGGERIIRSADLPAGISPVAAAAWADLCLATLNLNEFVYVR